MINYRDKNISLIILILFFLSGLLVLLSESFLSWDASYHLFVILETKDFFHIYDREFIYILQAPLIFLLKWFPQLDLIYAKKIFGISYSFLPFIVLFLTQKLKDNSFQFQFISLGLVFPFFFTQFHTLSEHIIACQLFFLLLLSINKFSLKITAYENILIALMLYCHPVGVYLSALYVMSKNLFFPIKGHYLSLCISMLLISYRVLNFLNNKTEHSFFTTNKIIKGLWLDSFFIIPERDIPLISFLLCIPICISTIFKKNILFYISLALFTFLNIYWLFNVDNLIYILLSRFYVFILATFFYLTYIYMLKKDLKPDLKKYAILSALSLLILTSVRSFQYRKNFNQLDKYISKHSACVEQRDLKQRTKYTWDHWTVFFEYSLLKGKKEITHVISNNRCPYKMNPKETKIFSKWINGNIVYLNNYFKVNL